MSEQPHRSGPAALNNTRPFTEAHAVASVDVALIFADELAVDVQNRLVSSLERNLRGFKRLPDKERANTVAAFQRKIDDDIAEEVHVHGHYVHVVLWDYRGWSRTKEEMLGRLNPVLKMARAGDLELSSAGLVFHDVFINDQPSTYSPSEVFQLDSPYLPAAALSAGDHWRLAFSWVDETALGLSLRSSLTVEASIQPLGDDDEPAHVTAVKHRQEIVGTDSVGPELEWSEDRVNLKFDSAHGRNKDVLSDLLTSEMSEKIGLKEVPNGTLS